MADIIRKSNIVPETGVSFVYGGTTPITVDPPIAGTSTVTKDAKTYVPAGNAYQFSTSGAVIATINHDSQVNQVTVRGGTTAAGTTPFTVTVVLSQ